MDSATEQRNAHLLEISRQAGRVHRRYFGSDLEIRNKGDVDLVTQADIETEELLVGEIRKRFPDDGVLTEEGHNRDCKSRYRWIIDPLDGTTNFAHGVPHFAVSIGLEERGVLISGVVYDPIKDELFRAAVGEGAFLNDRPIRTGQKKSLQACLCVSGFPYDRRTKLPVLMQRVGNALALSHGFRRLGAASLDLAYVACGRLDVFWEDSLHAWDMAAGVVLVNEAGGTVTRFDGRRFDLFSGEIVAAHPDLIRDVIDRIISGREWDDQSSL